MRVERAGDVLHVVLARPGKRNALSAAMRDALCDALGLVALDPSIARAELSGEGENFCAGGDFQEFGSAGDLASAHVLRLTASAALAVHRVRERVSVRGHGAIVGGGLEIAAAAGDFRVRPGAQMWLPEVTMGLIPGRRRNGHGAAPHRTPARPLHDADRDPHRCGDCAGLGPDRWRRSMTDAARWLTDVLCHRAGYEGPLSLPAQPTGTARERWLASGLAGLTGPSDGEPVVPARDYAARLEALVRATRALAAVFGVAPPSLGLGLYAERVGDLGLRRAGRVSAGGATRMLRCADDWAVVNLARPEDLDMFEAWIGEPCGDSPWATLSRAASRLDVETFVSQGRLLGLPLARVAADTDEQLAARPGQAEGAPGIDRWGPVGPPRDPADLVVVDLSGLWAGPLCGRLFAELGATVIKVESTTRPDGARHGSLAFFARMNGGKECIALDFQAESGREALRALIEGADVVIEAARPRAMAQLGVDPAAMARSRPRLVWISLTAYGRTGPWSNAVGFGDDCAAAGGLVVRDGAGAPMFVGDALADPVAGLMSAAAGFAVLAAGGGALVDVSLREAARFVAHAPAV